VIALSPDHSVLFQADVEGYAQLVLLKSDSVLSYLNFHVPVTAAKFSPDGQFLAVALGAKLKVFECEFKRHRTGALLPHLNFGAWHSDLITHLNWTDRYLVTSSADLTVRFCDVLKTKGYVPITLTGHRKAVLGAFLLDDLVFTVSADARVFVWKWMEASHDFLRRQAADYRRRVGKEPKEHSNTQQLQLLHKHQLQHEGVARLSSCDMRFKLLVVGFVNGNFALYSASAKEMTQLHTLSMSEYEISFISVSSSAEWVAFASKTLGQLLVWEWKSETYVMRQTGHSSEITCTAYGPDGTTIATGGVDGKVKLWLNGMCFATFTEHSQAVSGLAFTKSNALVSSSFDSTVRAYDTNRYKQFRVMTTPRAVQLTCVAVDRSGDLVAAGAEDFSIYVWALHTGNLCEVLAGHTGPVSCIAFTALNACVSGSWDRTVRVWGLIDSKSGAEAFEHNAEVLAIAVRGDGKELAVSLTNGEISLWNIPDSEENGVIEGRRDVAGGRGFNDRITAKHNPSNKRFNALAYSVDGSVLLAGGQSKFICVYDLRHKTLLHRFAATENRSLSGVLDKLNSKRMTSEGPMDEFDLDEYSYKDDFNTQGVAAPQRPGDLARKAVATVKVVSLAYSATGQSFAVVTSEGLLVYSTLDSERFAPVNLSVEVTSENVVKAVVQEQYATGLLLALKLGDEALQRNVLYRVPLESISDVVINIAGQELLRLVALLSAEITTSLHVEFLLAWVLATMKWHGKALKGLKELRAVQKAVTQHFTRLESLCSSNFYTVRYLASQST
jgi:periodic tryptophan protein 2